MTEPRPLGRLESLFQACLELPDSERAPYLDRECPSDPAMRAAVEDLLARDAGSGAAAPFLTIGPYRIGEKLGEGGFGEVYAAEQFTPVRRRVALKILKAGMDSRAILARFETERQALAFIDHPGVARVLDAGEAPGGRPFYVMELVDGEPITGYVERHALPLRGRLELFVAVCRAVEHAHQKGIIHRDLKPSNILVTQTDGRPAPKVIDFGIAKAALAGIAGGTQLTQPGDFLGTPEYMSPEQAVSSGADVDTRSDVYSLGVVLYRLLAGRLPFESAHLRGSGMAGMQRILLEEEPVRPSLAARAASGAPGASEGQDAPATSLTPRELRGDLDWIVLKAMDKDRGRRYPSAAALAGDLEHYLRSEPVEAGPPSTLYRFRKLVVRRRGLVTAVAAVALVLLAGTAVSLLQALRATRAEEHARREAATATAVNAFLTGMLGSADPEQNPLARQTTVREAVDKAAAEIASHRDMPVDVEAGVRNAVGMTYMGLGLYAEAEPHLLRAAQLRQAASGPTAPASVSAWLSVGELLGRKGNYLASDSLLRVLEPSLRDTSRYEAALRSRWLTLRGGNLGNTSHFEEADSLLAAGAALIRRSRAGGAATLSRALGDLAELRLKRGRFQEAEALGRESLALARQAHRGRHHDVAYAAGRLSSILQQLRALPESEALIRESLEIDRHVMGERHPIVGLSLNNLGLVLENQGHLEEAERVQRQALDIASEALGQDHLEVITLRGNLATVLQSAGKLDQALVLRRAALASGRRALGNGHEQTGVLLNNLGATCRVMKRYEEAADAFREALVTFRGVGGELHPNVAIGWHNLGRTRLDQGRHAEAERAVHHAVDLGTRIFPPGHPTLAIFHATHGRALALLGRTSEAATELRDAHRIILAALGPDHAKSREVAGWILELRPARRP